MTRARPALFWLFLGGFCWVLGDLFQQYAAKYIGIGRGIPLSNTNQLWGLAWGALVFGELAGHGLTAQVLVIAGSLIMIVGARAISFAEAPAGEQASWRKAMDRECDRYGIEGRARGGDSARGRRRFAGTVAAALVGIPGDGYRDRHLRVAGSGRRTAGDIGESGVDGAADCGDAGVSADLRLRAVAAYAVFVAGNITRARWRHTGVEGICPEDPGQSHPWFASGCSAWQA